MPNPTSLVGGRYLRPRLLVKGRATRVAEFCARAIGCAACRASQRQRCSARIAEPGALPILTIAAWTLHHLQGPAQWQHAREHRYAKLGSGNAWRKDHRSLVPFSLDATETEMAGRGVCRLGVARRRTIAPAIARRAEERAALDHLARDLDIGLARIVAVLLARPARILGHATRFLLRVARDIPVRGPFHTLPVVS